MPLAIVTVDPSLGNPLATIGPIVLWLLFAGTCIACVWKYGI